MSTCPGLVPFRLRIPAEETLQRAVLMESIVIGLLQRATYDEPVFFSFSSLRPRYTRTKFAETAAFSWCLFTIVMPIFRGENSRTLVGLVLIIVIGGYQLVTSFPGSHSAFSCFLLIPDGEGTYSPPLRLE